MAKGQGYVIDCDMHVIEPPDLWSFLGIQGSGWSGLKVDGQEILPEAYRRDPDPFQYTHGIMKHYRDGFTNNWDARSTIAAMDREGIDEALLLPTRGLLAVTLELSSLVHADICHRYHDWIKDYCSYCPTRLKWAALCMDEDRTDYSAIVIRPNKITDVKCRLAELKNIPLVLHEGTTPTDPGIGTDRTSNRLEAHIVSHQFEAMNAVMRLTVGGLLHDYPKLRVLICETGSRWLEPWLDRLDEEALGVNGYGIYNLPRKPSYYAQNIFTVHNPSDGSCDKNAVFGSDYPHGDSKFPYAVAESQHLIKKLSENSQVFLYGHTRALD